MTSAQAEYVMGRNPEETQRLRDQSHFYDPFTRALLLRAGIEKGMSVVDLGCGAGDVTMILADIVGPQGRAIGVDCDASILEVARSRSLASGHGNISYVQDNLEQPEFEQLSDAVVGRLILVHLRDPVAALKAFARRLQGPRIAVFQDIDWSIGPVANPPSVLLAQVWRWIPEMFGRAGLNANMGTNLRRVMLEAGFEEPSMQIDAPAGGGPDFKGYDYIASGLRSNMPHIVRYGIARDVEIDIETFAERLRRETVDQGGTIALPAFVGAWARLRTAA